MPNFTLAVIEYKGEVLSWGEIASRLRACDERGTASAWEMGDMALAAVPMGGSGVHTGADERLAALADESGVDFDVLERRRRVSSMVPGGTRVPSVCWTAYRLIVDTAGPDPVVRAKLFDLVTSPAQTKSKRWTVDALRRHLGKAGMLRKSDTAREKLKDAPTEELVEVTRDLLADPNIRAAAAASGSVLGLAVRAVADEMDARDRERGRGLRVEADERERQARERDPAAAAEMDTVKAMQALLQANNAYARAVGEALQQIKEVPAEGVLKQSFWVKESAIRVRSALEMVEALVATGRPGGDVDAFFRSVMDAEDKPGSLPE